MTALHHIVYQQHVRQFEGDLDDPRNLMIVGDEEHERHHKRTEPFPVSRLPSRAFEYAAELLGPERAFNYLRRRYQGADVRLDALLRPCVTGDPGAPESGIPCCIGCCCTCGKDDWEFGCECHRGD